MELRVVGYDHRDAVLLVEEVQAEYVRRYGGPDETPTEPGEFAPPRGLFVIGYVDGLPAVCGGWRARDGGEESFADGDAEIKRMYVTPPLRNRGLARALLAELERTAAAAGRRRMVLETGWAQPEAISLYASCGYTAIAGFGVYRDHDGNRCYAKSLQPHPSSPGFSLRVEAPTV